MGPPVLSGKQGAMGSALFAEPWFWPKEEEYLHHCVICVLCAGIQSMI